MKRQKKSDRLSEFPDHILVHIINFLNTKQSVQTCVLSKRWKSLWKSLTNLTLHHTKERGGIFKKFVSKILSGHDNSFPLHSLRYVDHNVVDCLKTTPLEVMKYAASHNVQQLMVNVRLWTIKDVEFPPSIFDSHSLTFLKLEFWSSRRGKMFPKSLNLPALKTLHLDGLTFTTSENGCVEPFSTCNMLSTLVIKDWFLQDDAHTLSISNSNVSSLTMSSAHSYEAADNCKSLYIIPKLTFKLLFCTPKLTSLTIEGHPIFPAPSACNFPFLEEVNINYSFFGKSTDRLIVISWLQLLADVKIMTLGLSTLEMMLMVLKNNDSIRKQLPCFVRLKSLKVDGNWSSMSDESIREMAAYLLQDSPPHVEINIVRAKMLNFFNFSQGHCPFLLTFVAMFESDLKQQMESWMVLRTMVMAVMSTTTSSLYNNNYYSD